MLWVCDQCTARYAVGLLRCPQCGGLIYHQEGDTVPKTNTAGVSNLGEQLETEAECLGSSSSPSETSASPTPLSTESVDQKPAPTTASPSKKGRQARSTARAETGMSGSTGSRGGN